MFFSSFWSELFVCLTENEEKETVEMLATKQELSTALKARRTELEDKLYDKVQELKKLCLQEAVWRYLISIKQFRLPFLMQIVLKLS